MQALPVQVPGPSPTLRKAAAPDPSFASKLSEAREIYQEDGSRGPALLEELAALHPTAGLLGAAWTAAGTDSRAQDRVLKAAFDPQMPWDKGQASAGGFLLLRMGASFTEMV